MPDRPFHKPTLFGPAALDKVPGGQDPANRHEAAFATARLLVSRGREAEPEAVERLVALGDTFGLDLLADLWAEAPAESLPGALWRLYILRAWIRGNPRQAAREFDAGRVHAPVHEVVAGVVEPPGPDQVVAVADQILHGVYRGDFAVALDRAAAFARIVATGRAGNEPGARSTEETEAEAMSAARLIRTAEQLAVCSRLWRSKTLLGMESDQE